MESASWGEASGYGPLRPVVLMTREPSMGWIRLGKISQVYPHKMWAYLNNVSAEMRKHEEYAVAPCVITLMEAWGVGAIGYFDKARSATFWITTERLKALGRLVGYSYRPAYWHCPVAYWQRAGGCARSKFTEEVLRLEWETPALSPEPRAQQLALSF